MTFDSTRYYRGRREERRGKRCIVCGAPVVTLTLCAVHRDQARARAQRTRERAAGKPDQIVYQRKLDRDARNAVLAQAGPRHARIGRGTLCGAPPAGGTIFTTYVSCPDCRARLDETRERVQRKPEEPLL